MQVTICRFVLMVTCHESILNNFDISSHMKEHTEEYYSIYYSHLNILMNASWAKVPALSGCQWERFEKQLIFCASLIIIVDFGRYQYLGFADYSVRRKIDLRMLLSENSVIGILISVVVYVFHRIAQSNLIIIPMTHRKPKLFSWSGIYFTRTIGRG